MTVTSSSFLLAVAVVAYYSSVERLVVMPIMVSKMVVVAGDET
jgi:hypothetical protein